MGLLCDGLFFEVDLGDPGGCFFPTEKFIQNVLKNVGREHVDVDTLTLQDVDQLSSLIADALQVVDQDRRGLGRFRGPGPRDVEGDLSDEKEEEEVTAGDEEEKKKLLESVPTAKPQESTPEPPPALEGDFIEIQFVLF